VTGARLAVPFARTAVALLALTAVGTMAYWVAFFTSGATQSTHSPEYLAFERAFPAADAWMAIAAAVAATGLHHRGSYAVAFGIAAGSALVFLGAMDVLYNLENDMYALRSAEMTAEIGINVWCFTVGPGAMWYFWRHRRLLDP
jgi:hypothetical protein